MSFSNAPNDRALGRVAGALAVDEAFVEKDWFVVQAIRTLVDFGHSELTPVFSGGTALLKGYGLIQRFSEDIDFKLALSPAFTERGPAARRSTLSTYRDALAAAWIEQGFTVANVASHRANAFFQFELIYPSTLEPHGSLRPHILAEISARPPRLSPIGKPVTSFVAQTQGEASEIAEVPCIDPVETAADKLSAFTWRVLARDRQSAKDDPAIVRHLHDLAMLQPIAAASPDFVDLVGEALSDDSMRAGLGVAEMAPRDRLDAMLATIADDPAYETEYRRFVGDMAFAGEPEVPVFEAARAALGRLVDICDFPTS